MIGFSQWKRFFIELHLLVAIKNVWLLTLIFINISSIFVYSNNIIDIQERIIKFPKSKESVYQLLTRISDQTGLMFIYDSDLIDNNKLIKLKPANYSFSQAVKLAVGNDDILLRIEGRHALLFRKEEGKIEPDKNIKKIKQINDSIAIKSEFSEFITIEGSLKDRITGDPIFFATVSLNGTSIGTVSNLNGYFKLILPDSLIKYSVKISHLGYELTEIPASLIAGQNIIFSLNQKLVSLQEVVVRAIDPLKTIREMLKNRAFNYDINPVLMTLFYREGVEFGKSGKLTEAVLQVYKTGYRNTIESEYVKLLKMRKISNPGIKDSILAKVKSSIYSFQQLDIIKNLPDFLDPDYAKLYNYNHSDIVYIDNRRVLVISFAQKPEVYDALYRGELYIDAENLSLLRAKFEMNPEYIHKAADVFVVKKDRALDVKPSSVVYDVDYKSYRGKYYINHIRGDIDFKIKRRWKIFNSPLKVWFEMVNCKIDEAINPIPPYERISTRDILSEILFTYDPEFWGSFNVIMPESQIIDLISNKIK